GQRPEDHFERTAECSEAPYVANMVRLEEILRAVKRQQRSHPVIGEPLPAFREGEIAQPARMAQKGAVGLVVPLLGSRCVERRVHTHPSTLPYGDCGSITALFETRADSHGRG